jgi:hypothetical protein
MIWHYTLTADVTSKIIEINYKTWEVLNSRYLFLIVYRLHLYKTLCKLVKMEESNPVPETILEEAEEATRQLLI